MATNKAKRHTHKYYKAELSYHTVWACALPDCSHHMPPHMSKLVLGKGTICWNCGEQTLMDDRTMAMDKPLCTDCDPNSVNLENVDENTLDILKNLGVLGKLE